MLDNSMFIFSISYKLANVPHLCRILLPIPIVSLLLCILDVCNWKFCLLAWLVNNIGIFTFCVVLILCVNYGIPLLKTQKFYLENRKAVIKIVISLNIEKFFKLISLPLRNYSSTVVRNA